MDPQPSPTPTPPVKPAGTSGWAISALVLSLLGICFFPFSLVGLVLGIVGIVKTGPTGKGGRGLAIAAVCLAPLTIVVTGILAAIAIPNFMRYQGHAKQQECRIGLLAAYNAEKAFFAEKEHYSEKIHEVEFAPERGNHYAYFFSSAGSLEDRSGTGPRGSQDDTGIAVDTSSGTDSPVTAGELPPLAGGARLGVSGTCPQCTVTLACAGRPGQRGALDVWSISSDNRQDAQGTPIPAGLPHNDQDGAR